MKCTIVYDSLSGNTKKLASGLLAALPQGVQGEMLSLAQAHGAQAPLDADVLFIGFWTRTGACSADLSKWMGTLEGRTIGLFGTGGFYDAPEYFASTLSHVKRHLPPSNRIAAEFMCLGKVQPGVHASSVLGLTNMGAHHMADQMESAYRKARIHPNDGDIAALCSAMLPLVEG